MDTRTERMDSVCESGRGLIRSGHSSTAEIQEALIQMEKAKSGLEEAWLDRSSILSQARTLQVTLPVQQVYSCFNTKSIHTSQETFE